MENSHKALSEYAVRTCSMLIAMMRMLIIIDSPELTAPSCMYMFTVTDYANSRNMQSSPCLRNQDSGKLVWSL